jgi:glycosyltransferase involved in cell wall biosynthesis
MPYPPGYGGVVDVFYRIEALKKQGIGIVLHVVSYETDVPQQLESLCEKVFVYKRKRSLASLFGRLPFIVASRMSDFLLENLVAFQYPILFEGIHCCGFLSHALLSDRVKIVRAHNVEHHYYQKLSEAEPNILKKLYFKLESSRLRTFELVLNHATSVLCISKTDRAYFEKYDVNPVFIPPFHHTTKNYYSGETDRVALYHGNIRVAENRTAAKFLIDKVLPHLKCPLIIAGKNASTLKTSLSEKLILIDSPSDQELNELIARSAVHVLPTFSPTGFKIKLLHALEAGKHVVVNSPMVEGTGLENLCVLAESAGDMAGAVNDLINEPFTESAFEKRRALLDASFSNEVNAKKIINLLHQQTH